MPILRQRRSHARSSTNPFRVPQPSIVVDHATSAAALALLIASWIVVYVTIVPADPAPAHRVHIVQAQR